MDSALRPASPSQSRRLAEPLKEQWRACVTEKSKKKR